jgi:kynurenine 3-monooxygenase
VPDGTKRYQPYGKNSDEVLHSIDRNELRMLLLLDRAEQHGQVKLHFGHRLARVIMRSAKSSFRPDGSVTAHPMWWLVRTGPFR